MVDLHENLLNSATSPFGDDTFSTSAPSASCSERHNEKHSCNNASDSDPVGSVSTSAIAESGCFGGKQNRIIFTLSFLRSHGSEGCAPLSHPSDLVQGVAMMTHMITDQLPLLSCLPAPSYERPYFPSPLPALFSRRYSHKHHHYHQLSCVALRSSSYKPSSHPRLFPSAVSSMTSSDSGPLSEPPPDVAFSSLFVALFFLLVRVALKLR